MIPDAPNPPVSTPEPKAFAPMTTPLDHIPLLAAWLAETGLDSLDLSGPGGSVSLRRGAAPSPGLVPASVPEAEAEATDRTLVLSPGMGAFLRTHPLRDEALAKDGATVEAGQILALLRVGAALFPVRATASGVLAAVLREEGALTGYGDPLFDIRPCK
jgi:biotin carboxyl carrier protein